MELFKCKSINLSNSNHPVIKLLVLDSDYWCRLRQSTDCCYYQKGAFNCTSIDGFIYMNCTFLPIKFSTSRFYDNCICEVDVELISYTKYKLI